MLLRTDFHTTYRSTNRNHPHLRHFRLRRAHALTWFDLPAAAVVVVGAESSATFILPSLPGTGNEVRTRAEIGETMQKYANRFRRFFLFAEF